MEQRLKPVTEYLQIARKNIGKTLQHIGIDKGFLEKTSKADTTKAKFNHWDYIELWSFCPMHETVNKVMSQPTEWEKMFVNYATDRWLIYRISKEFKRLSNNTINNPFKKLAKDINRQFSRNKMKMANTHQKMFRFTTYHGNANKLQGRFPLWQLECKHVKKINRNNKY